MRKHGGTCLRRDKYITPALIGFLGVALGRFVGATSQV